MVNFNFSKPSRSFILTTFLLIKVDVFIQVLMELDEIKIIFFVLFKTCSILKKEIYLQFNNINMLDIKELQKLTDKQMPCKRVSVINLVLRSFQTKSAFTLVELIVVITILSILSTIGYISVT